MKCKRCKANVRDGSTFCTNCGEPFTNFYDDPAENSPRPKSKKNNTFLIICLVVAGLMILATAAIILLDKMGHEVPFFGTDEEEVQQESQDTSSPEPTVQATPQPTVVETATDTPDNPQDHIYGLNASSTLPDSQDNSYDVLQIVDGSKETAWIEGAEGEGIGEKFGIIFDKECSFKGFIINAGYQKSEDIYYKNSRPKTIRVEFSDGTQLDYELEDKCEEQKIVFPNEVKADSFFIIILSVYEGSRYEDTAISELSVF